MVFIRSTDFRTFSLENRPEDTVYNLKSMIQHNTGISIEMQHLSVDGKPLVEADKLLSDYNVQLSSNLQLVVMTNHDTEPDAEGEGHFQVAMRSKNAFDMEDSDNEDVVLPVRMNACRHLLQDEMCSENALDAEDHENENVVLPKRMNASRNVLQSIRHAEDHNGVKVVRRSRMHACRDLLHSVSSSKRKCKRGCLTLMVAVQ
mmetsp:Transcript_110084/g.206390  ORF Transcript_110084/g.206390 Transcript_110084/m.206390 type:complete len:203 (-) Transcript_110084:237-845(-)